MAQAQTTSERLSLAKMKSRSQPPSERLSLSPQDNRPLSAQLSNNPPDRRPLSSQLSKDQGSPGQNIRQAQETSRNKEKRNADSNKLRLGTQDSRPLSSQLSKSQPDNRPLSEQLSKNPPDRRPLSERLRKNQGSPRQNIQQAQEDSRNQKKQKADGKKGGGKALKQAEKKFSLVILNALWSSVLTPLFPLVVIGLDIYLFCSLVFPSMTQLGEDTLGTPFGGGLMARTGISDATMAKNMEIVMLLVLNLALLILIGLVFVLIALMIELVTNPLESLQIIAVATWLAIWNGMRAVF